MKKSKKIGVLVSALILIFVLGAGSALGYAVGIQEDFPETIAANNPSPGEADVPAAKDQFIVKYKDTTSEAEENQIEKDEKTPTKETIEKIDTDVLEVPEGKDSHQMVSEFRAEHADKIEYAELDGIVEPQFAPNDPTYPDQWNLHKIQAGQAWDVTQGSDSAVIAVLDTGVNSSHRDLSGKIVSGWNVVSNSDDTADINGHGTAMMGIAGAQTNNAVEIAGVAIAPKLMMVRISNNSNGSAYESDMAKGIIYAADHSAKVISISYGGSGFSVAVENAIEYAYGKGVLIAAAAGNANSNSITYPAAYNHVMAVGATDENDQKASFSNYGSWVDIVSPGVNIYTLPAGDNSATTAVSGTSASTPHIAGLAALIYSIAPNLMPDEVINFITANTDDLGAAGKDDIFGWGRMNMCKTMVAVNPTSVPSGHCSTPEPAPQPAPLPWPPTGLQFGFNKTLSSVSGNTQFERNQTINQGETTNVGANFVTQEPGYGNCAVSGPTGFSSQTLIPRYFAIFGGTGTSGANLAYRAYWRTNVSGTYTLICADKKVEATLNVSGTQPVAPAPEPTPTPPPEEPAPMPPPEEPTPTPPPEEPAPIPEPTPPPPQQGSISGKITNAKDNSPIVGAKIVVSRQGGSQAQLTSSSAGSYWFSDLLAGSYDIVVSAQGYQGASRQGVAVVEGQDTGGINFVLEPIIKNGAISGKVTDSRKKPVKGTKVVLSLVVTPRRDVKKFSRTAKTDKNGRFSFGDLPEGAYYLKSLYQAQFADRTVSVLPNSTSQANLQLSRQNLLRWLKSLVKRK